MGDGQPTKCGFYIILATSLPFPSCHASPSSYTLRTKMRDALRENAYNLARSGASALLYVLHYQLQQSPTKAKNYLRS